MSDDCLGVFKINKATFFCVGLLLPNSFLLIDKHTSLFVDANNFLSVCMH